ncbi:MAG: NADP-dependent isocitrate dehydrogenase [Anaerolinea sp.]|nr:NADP-dependent isocitrate dehydrogenase [Anaerolinea sp.]
MPKLPSPVNEQIIQFIGGKIQVPDQPVIPYIEGDGVGPEIWRAARQVMEGAVELAYQGKRQILWKELLAGGKAFNLTGSWLPQETLLALKTYHIGMKGPLTTPIGEGIRSLNVALRKELDLYTSLRPVKYMPGAPSPLQKPENVDIVLFRENTEDVYAGIEFESGSVDAQTLVTFLQERFPDSYARLRFPSSSAIGLKPISREGSERIVRTAIEWALHNHRKSLTIIHKGNIMKYTEGAFMKWGYALAENDFAEQIYSMHQWKETAQKSGEAAANLELEYAKNAGRLIIRDMIVDAAFERAIIHPQDLDVIVTTNLNGDYLSDALAALVGGLGIAPGANINFVTGDAIFEAAHGTAPAIAGKNIANPSSLILSSVLMLRYLGWNEAANLVENGLRKTLASRHVTADFYDQVKNATLLSTSEFAEQIIQRM